MLYAHINNMRKMTDLDTRKNRETLMYVVHPIHGLHPSKLSHPVPICNVPVGP